MHQLTLIDDEINKAYKLKELYRSFDNISKDEINDYDMEKELNSIIKQFRYSQIEEMKEVADTLNNWKKEILNSFVWVKNRRISNGPIEGKNYYIKKIIYIQCCSLATNSAIRKTATTMPTRKTTTLHGLIGIGCIAPIALKFKNAGPEEYNKYVGNDNGAYTGIVNKTLTNDGYPTMAADKESVRFFPDTDRSQTHSFYSCRT